MGKHATTTGDSYVQSVRISSVNAEWLTAQSKARGGLAMSVLITELMDGARTWCGLPPEDAELLAADAATAGLTQAQYLQRMLVARRNELLREQLSRSAGGVKRK